MKKPIQWTLIAASALMAGAVFAGTPAPPDAAVYFVTPADGAVVKSPVTVKFGLKGVRVAPAGVPKTGHHHLLIDVAKLPAPDRPVPVDANHKHFDGGQTETTIELAPGTHTLQLLLGDINHIPHDPPVVSEKITIKVK